jgi:hypothetical protein
MACFQFAVAQPSTANKCLTVWRFFVIKRAPSPDKMLALQQQESAS